MQSALFEFANKYFYLLFDRRYYNIVDIFSLIIRKSL